MLANDTIPCLCTTLKTVCAVRSAVARAKGDSLEAARILRAFVCTRGGVTEAHICVVHCLGSLPIH